MRKLIPILALSASVIAGPAFAATNTQTHASGQVPAMHRQSPVVTFDGKRGQDPDPLVRLQILRDQEAGHT